MTCKMVPDMTYNVFGWALNLAQFKIILPLNEVFHALLCGQYLSDQ